MIKTIDEIKDQEAFKKFQEDYSNDCQACLKEINEVLDNFAKGVGCDFANLEEVREDIKNLIMVKLSVRVPDHLIFQAPIINAEKEPKKRGRKATK